MDERIAQHYSQGGILASIQSALATTVGESRAVTIDDVAPVDEFHIGGRRATAHLIDQIGVSPGQHVLDIGAGIGGSARYVAHTYGCKVTGVDLTSEFCQVAEHLTGLVGMQDQVEVRQGDAMSLPFDDATFDAAYTVHVGMNIPDKSALFAEARRVLRPGGMLAVYDILKGPSAGDLQFPVPWATDPSCSFLAAPEEMKEALERAGLAVERTEDRTSFALEFFEAQVAAQVAGQRSAIGLHLLMGPTAGLKLTNMIANVKNGLCGPWEFIARKVA